MVKRIFVILSVLSLIVAAGCSSGNITTSTSAPPAGIKTIRLAEIAGAWTVRQIEINLESSTSVLLKLTEGDKVEGYFFLEKGIDIDFQILGESLIYRSRPVSGSDNVTSDRFSFTATGDQGIAYTLKFSPVVKKDGKKVIPTVFLELIYPATGEVFDPMGVK
jgi:hypothetical protein